MAEVIDNYNQIPQNLDAEANVLGSILFDPQNAYEQALEILTPHDFYKNEYRIIFESMINLYENGTPIEINLLIEDLTNRNLFDQVNIESFNYISGKVVTAENVSYYANIVREKSLKRGLIAASSNITKLAYELSEEPIEDILSQAEKSILEVTENQRVRSFIHIQEVINENYETLQSLSENRSEVTGISTGYPDLDRMTAGLHPDELIILAARPAVGKTAFALNIAQNVAVRGQQVVAVFSLEMGAESLVNRMLCAEGAIDAGHLRTGQLTEEEWNSLFIAMGTLAKSKIYIDDTPGIRIQEIRAKAKRLKKEQGELGLIVIDYLQLIESSRRSENRQQEVSEISRQLKKLAKELKVPVIALSQLSRGVESRNDKRPVLSDIRESGSIEQDADIVAFLYREDYYRSEEEEEPVDNNIVEVIIEKNRAGARGTVPLLFTKEHNKFSSVSRLYE